MSAPPSAAKRHPSRTAIIDAATEIFAARGFHGATMREIAAQAGVSQALLHHYFEGKEALWRQAGERASARFLDYMAGAIAPDTPAREGVARAMRSYMRYWQEHPAAFRFNLWRLLEGPSDERKRRSEALNRSGVPVMQRAQAAGCLRDDMPAGMLLIIAGSLVQFWLHSQTEIGDALAVTGDTLPSDEEFLACVLGLIERKPAATPRRKRAHSKETRA